MLAVLMGGRLAEEIFIGEITTGAGNDIERASAMARRMVCEWGMSDLGPVTFAKKEEAILLGREFAQHQDFSEATAVEIDVAQYSRQQWLFSTPATSSACSRSKGAYRPRKPMFSSRMVLGH